VRLDKLLTDANENPDMAARRSDYLEAQQILANDLPAFNLWYLNTIVVHSQRLSKVVPSSSGDYGFLKTAELAN
jgi:peptide/nickel transport system substrate-binding protein